MRRERSAWIYFALMVLWLVIGVSRAAMMIGYPTRWVDVITIIAAGILAGVYLARIKYALRSKSVPAPETSSGTPNVPK